jgi:hypothetical protein
MIAETARRGHAPAADAATVLRRAASDGTLSSHPTKNPARGQDARGSRVRFRPGLGPTCRSVQPWYEGRTSVSILQPCAPPGQSGGPHLPCAPTPIVLAADEHTIPSFTADVIAFCRDRRAARVALRRRSLRRRRRLHTPTLAIGRERLP